MKKVSLIRKLLFFLGLASLNNDIDLDFNYKTRMIIFFTFILPLYILNEYYLDIFINNTNMFFRFILLSVYLYAYVEILYRITMKQYKKFKK